MPSAERPYSKFLSCPRSFASRLTVHFETIVQSLALFSDIPAAERDLHLLKCILPVELN